MAKDEDEELNNTMDNVRKSRWVPQWFSVSLLIIVCALVYILFLQENNYFVTNENRKKINELKEEIQINLDSANYYSQKSRELNTGRELLEKVAREQYYMKRPNEDVYVTDIK